MERKWNYFYDIDDYKNVDWIIKYGKVVITCLIYKTIT